MLELLKELNSEKFDIVCAGRKYYSVKIIECKLNFLVVETKQDNRMLVNVDSISTITPAKDFAYGTIVKNIRL
ncbi:MAG: hypothetical protein Q7K48_06205 [Fusobacterium sp. JB021]|nr:hypothetical protein [Fusobacterium sp. JB020]MDP0493871.1 hypothetical protein [Fusobacterium sp. JB021]MDP0506911.1 hypothetical protein [Fusobacterium sp. JB019]